LAIEYLSLCRMDALEQEAALLSADPLGRLSLESKRRAVSLDVRKFVREAAVRDKSSFNFRLLREMAI
jgi:Arc/MetJ family transcription regulator